MQLLKEPLVGDDEEQATPSHQPKRNFSRTIVILLSVACIVAGAIGVAVTFSHPEGSDADSQAALASALAAQPMNRAAFDIDWNDSCKAVAGFFLGKIPYIGSALSFLVSTFWPSTEVSIWDSIKDKVAAVVDVKILQFEMQERNSELTALKTTMKRYVLAGNNEKGSMMSAMLEQADVMLIKMQSSTNRLHMLPYLSVFSQLHMTLLAERYHHGAELFPGDSSHSLWESDLQETYSGYKDLFNQLFDEWYTWRSNQITINRYVEHSPSTIPPFYFCTSHGDVTDSVTHSNLHYSEGLLCVETFDTPTRFVKESWMNRAVADMAAALSGTYYLHYYLPGNTDKAPRPLNRLKTLWLGPYSVATVGINAYGASNPASAFGQTADDYKSSISGTTVAVTRVIVREYNSIDGLQVTYGGYDGSGSALSGGLDGSFSGNPKGGALHEIKLEPKQHFTGFRMRFANGILTSVDVAFSNRKSTGVMGNRGNWKGVDVDATVDSTYVLDGAKYIEGTGPSNTKGTALVYLRFGVMNNAP